MIDVRKLRMLADLQRLGTIAAVADEMHLTAPGVSMQLAAFERELGVTLTRRAGRRLALTAAGALLAAHGHDILDRLSLAELELDALRAGTVGRYSVTAFPSAARTFVADAFQRILFDNDSGLELTLSTLEPENALAALANGAVDLAAIHSYSNVARDVPNGIVANTIGSEPVWLALRSDDRISAGGAPERLADFSDRPWIIPTPGVTCHTMVERACGLAGFRPRVVAETMDFSVQVALVAAGVGVALVPALTVDTVPDGVELVRLTDPIERKLLLAVREPGLGDPGIRNLLDIITATATARLSDLRVSPWHTK
jgi:DNA-binding transcriptional LysR family regulator